MLSAWMTLIGVGSSYPGVLVCRSVIHPFLQNLMQAHSDYMAAHNQGGHQGFSERVEKIQTQLGRSRVNEVAAQSWRSSANQDLVSIAKEMFDSWKVSPGHWAIISKVHDYFGGSMSYSKGGIWYASIITVDLGA